MKIGIAIISGDMMHTTTAFDLCHIVNYTSEALGHEVRLHHEGGSMLATQRQVAVRALLDWGADWIFCMDSDMRVPQNAIQGMMSHGEPIVAANCARRKRPISPIARRKSAFLRQDEEATEIVWPDKDRHGLERVETVGFGVILIRRDVFEQLPEPYFDTPWQAEQKKHCGEDIYFCWRCYEAGIPIYVDHDLSWAVRHTGMYEFGMQDTLAERKLVDTGAWEGKL